MAKFSVEYSRTVRVKAYNTVKIGLVMEFDTEDRFASDAFWFVRDKVEQWIEDSLRRLGADQVKPT